MDEIKDFIIEYGKYVLAGVVGGLAGYFVGDSINKHAAKETIAKHEAEKNIASAQEAIDSARNTVAQVEAQEASPVQAVVTPFQQPQAQTVPVQPVVAPQVPVQPPVQ